ncbi:MAG: hypothetical protein A2445_02175 [Candidatus Jacksonbacteria bacterium RIFOXYC2_FULL_44_29]|nr:MAG: hypothetical protein A2445_02175 [Candidatus Jacksonbacteria bacterium RIFOXYC2_FULL_44_29]
MHELNQSSFIMLAKSTSKLNRHKRYLQIALNSNLVDAAKIISQLPVSERIILEVGTPLIKRFGVAAIRQIKSWYQLRLLGPQIGQAVAGSSSPLLSWIAKQVSGQMSGTVGQKTTFKTESLTAYVVADLKMMDRGAEEVEIAYEGGADAAVALGLAPVESLDAFIERCAIRKLDAMIDMMNVSFPLEVLRKLKKPPKVVILHRGVDEEHFNREKELPLHEIQRIKGSYDMMIAVAGGDEIREVQRAIFNDADIVVVWKSFYQSTGDTARLAAEFLEHVK